MTPTVNGCGVGSSSKIVLCRDVINEIVCLLVKSKNELRLRQQCLARVLGVVGLIEGFLNDKQTGMVDMSCFMIYLQKVKNGREFPLNFAARLPLVGKLP